MIKLRRLALSGICVLVSLGSVINVTASGLTEELETVEVQEVLALSDQVSDLCDKVADELGIEPKQVRLLYNIYSIDPVYAGIGPNIYADETMSSLNSAATEIEKAPFIESGLERDSNMYLPDVLYSISKQFKTTYDWRVALGDRSEGFNALNERTKNVIYTYESILNMVSGLEIDIYPVYEKLMATKNSGENILEVGESGELQIKGDFLPIFESFGLTSDDVGKTLIELLSYDELLASGSDISDYQDYVIEPFTRNVNTQENMILAASSLVGKCRYVWGGGHSLVSDIDGINPAWGIWDEAYGDGNGSIRPAGTTCPIHGSLSGVCSGVYVSSITEYVESHQDIFGDNTYKVSNSDVLGEISFSERVESHRLDGLDCSGFVSWVYNQTTESRHYNAVAEEYVEAMGLEELPLESDLEPGDVFAWRTHIILIVAPYDKGSKAYLTLESVPDVVRFGVAYYAGVSSSDLNKVKELAKEANELIGGLYDSTQPVRAYNMSTVGVYEVTEEELNEQDENIGDTNELENAIGEENGTLENTGTAEDSVSETEKTISENGESELPEESENGVTYSKFSVIGRSKTKYDETYIEEYGCNFSELYATEMVQYIVDKLPYSYLSGYKTYENGDEKLIFSDNVRK